MTPSRRKQTNPNRVAAGPRDLDNGHLLDSNQAALPLDLRFDLSPVRDTSRPIYSHLHVPIDHGPEEVQPLDLHISAARCGQCSRTFSSRAELEDHETDMHGPETKKPCPEAATDDCPTVYHRLGRQLQTTDVSVTSSSLHFNHDTIEEPLSNGHGEEQDLSPVATVSFSTPSPVDLQIPRPEKAPTTDNTPNNISFSENSQPAMDLKMHKEGNNSELGNGGRSDRIFHIDAYCELCDREFCNKYFLKTHKANKHGIYEDNSPPGSNAPLSFPGLLMSPESLTPFNFSMDGSKPTSELLLPWSFNLDSSNQNGQPLKILNSSSLSKVSDVISCASSSLPVSVSSQDSPRSSTYKVPSTSSNYEGGHTVSASSSHTTPACAEHALTTVTSSQRGSGQFPTSSTTQAQDSNMEDYCHICQKHFCNKYYLRKHKHDVHGIIPEALPGNANKRPRSSLSDLSLPPTSNPLLLPQPLPHMSGLPGMPLPGMPPGVMVLNPFSLPPVALLQAGSLMPGQQLPPPPHHLISHPMNLSGFPDSFLPSATPTPTTSSMSHSNSSRQSPNASAMGPDGGSHCGLCSKEFCNEFYLQVHLESKHGFKMGHTKGGNGDGSPPVKEKKLERSSPMPQFLKAGNDSSAKQNPVEITLQDRNKHIYCHPCNKEFSDKEQYRVHRAREHVPRERMEPMFVDSTRDKAFGDDLLNSMKESFVRLTSGFHSSSSQIHPPSQKPPANIYCDICSRPMANLHCLRLHRFTVHGIEPISNDKFDRKIPISTPLQNSRIQPPTSSTGSSMNSSQQLAVNQLRHPMLPFLPQKFNFKDLSMFPDLSRDFNAFRDVPSFLGNPMSQELFGMSHNPPSHLDLNFFNFPPLGKLPGEENSLKMGFDPEAYCEICKKEFCSKYFLRTHKQNIHGIKMEGLGTTNYKVAEPERTNPSSPPPMTSFGANNSFRQGQELDKNAWRWKEPINSARVICDICNKEVCNKYFLRTHKQKKHGIEPSSQSPNVSGSSGSDCDSTSNNSAQADDKLTPLESCSLQETVPIVKSEALGCKVNNGNLEPDDVSHNNNTSQGDTCQYCSRRFQSCSWLKEHIAKEHPDQPCAPAARNTPPSSAESSFTCRVCGTDFPAQLSVQLHLLQEHNGRVTLDTEKSQIPWEEAHLPNSSEGSQVAELSARWTLRSKAPNHRRLKKYICTRCGFDSHWLSSLLHHERIEHGLAPSASSQYSCKSCRIFLSSSDSLSTHLALAHGLPNHEVLQEVQLTRGFRSHHFKCTHCSAIFPTRTLALSHVRRVHIRKRRDFTLKNSFQKRVLGCSSCPFTTHFPSRLQRHLKARHKGSACYSSLVSHSLESSFPHKFTSSTLALEGGRRYRDSSIMYTSIAASLLTSPGTKNDLISSASDKNGHQLNGFTLPVGPKTLDVPPSLKCVL